MFIVITHLDLKITYVTSKIPNSETFLNSVERGECETNFTLEAFLRSLVLERLWIAFRYRLIFGILDVTFFIWTWSGPSHYICIQGPSKWPEATKWPFSSHTAERILKMTVYSLKRPVSPAKHHFDDKMRMEDVSWKIIPTYVGYDDIISPWSLLHFCLWPEKVIFDPLPREFC